MKKLLFVCLILAISSFNCVRGTVIMRVGDDGTIYIDTLTKTDLFIFGTDSTKRNTGIRAILIDCEAHSRAYEYDEFRPLDYPCEHYLRLGDFQADKPRYIIGGKTRSNIKVYDSEDKQ